MDINRSRKVLYVDDEETNLALFKFTFGKKFDVITAISGSEGLLHLATDNSIMLVISDMKMPLMNGVEFIKKARSLRSDIFCVILSGYLKDEETDSMIKSGLLIDYLMKPFDRDYLTGLLEKHIGFKIKTQ